MSSTIINSQTSSPTIFIPHPRPDNDRTQQNISCTDKVSLSAPIISPEVRLLKRTANTRVGPDTIDPGTTRTRTSNSKQKEEQSMTKKKVIKDRWVCDICRIAAFDDFDEACKHEETCKGPTLGGQKQQHVIDQETETEIHNISLETEAPNVSSASTNSNVDSEPSSSSTDETEAIEDFAEAPILPKKLQFLPISTYVGSLDKDSLLLKCKSTPDNTNINIVSTIPKYLDATCRFENCEICGTHEKTQPKKSNSKGKRKSDRGGSPEVQIVESNVKKAKKKKVTSSTNSSAPTAPLFLPKKSKIANEKGKSATAQTTDKSKTPRTIAFASIFQKKTDKTSNSTSSTSANISPPAISEQGKRAILAEHRAVEFASKRRAQQLEEKQRQAKREKIRRSQYVAKQKQQDEEKLKQNKKEKTSQKDVKTASIFQPPPLNFKNAPKRRRVMSTTRVTESITDLTESPPLTMPTKAALLPAKQQKKKESKQINWKLFPPRFPNPSHIYQNHGIAEESSILEESMCRNGFEHLVSSSRFQQSVDSLAHSTLQPYKFEDSGACNSSIDQSNELDFLCTRFSSMIHPCVTSVTGDSGESYGPNQLWSDKYAMQSLPHDVYGQSNKAVTNDLIDFVNGWKEERQLICEARAERAAKLQGRKKKRKSKKKAKRCEHDDYDDGFYSDDDDGGLRNVYLLTGSTGSGKTSLARATARHCNCDLIEINTTTERGGRALKKEIEECTQSLSNIGLMGEGTSCGILQEDGDDESSKPSLTIILIDEVDILFESDGDQGFWQSLSSVAKKSRCPIVLTASSIPSQLEDSSIRYSHSELVRPTPFECVSKMCQIAKMEGMSWRKNVDRDKIKDGMAQIAKFCGCDLRRIMNEMQLYGLGPAISVSTKIPPFPPLSRCDVDNGSDMEAPSINRLSPAIVPSHAHTAITIKGKNFSQGAEVKLFVGNQISPCTKVINDETILAVIPPCEIPDDVDEFGFRKNIYGESLRTRYASIRLSIQRNGCILRSETVSLHSSHAPTKHLIEYSFPDRNDMDLRTEGALKTAKEVDVNTEELLDKLSKELKVEIIDIKSSLPVVCQSQSKNSQVEMDEISRHFELLSDSVLQSDANQYLSLPPLAGATSGFDDNLIIGTGNSHITSSEVCAWGSSDSCKGSSDTFMTMPTARRDLLLISNQCRYSYESPCSQGLSSSSLNACTETATVTVSEDADSLDSVFYGPRSSHEESYIPVENLCHLATLPTAIFNFHKYHNATNTMCCTDDVGVLCWEKKNLWTDVAYTADPFFRETRFIRNLTPEYCKLEYLPYLRSMAQIESIADENFAALKLKFDEESENFDQKNSRRRTRGSTAKLDEREHYFDEILLTARFDDKEGKAIGDKLAAMKLDFNSNSSSRS